MPKKPEKPFAKVQLTQMKLELYIEHGIAALEDQTLDEFLSDVHECFGLLCDFRNIVASMASFDAAPSVAVVPYLSESSILAAADAISREHVNKD